MLLRLKKICSITAALFFCTTAGIAQLNVCDSFETPGLNKIWSNDRMVPGAFKIQADIVHSGHAAAMITLKSNDIFETGIGKSKDSERDELREANNLFSAEGKLYEFRFSLFLPDSFPIVPVRLVLAQWKQYCGGDSSCSDDSPVMAIRYVSGRLYITLQNDSASKTVYETREEVRNKWLNFIFTVRLSRLGNGQVDAWLNKKQVINYRGVTAYTSKKGYPLKSYFYFKTGLYRDLMKEPMTIYIDDYQKKEIKE